MAVRQRTWITKDGEQKTAWVADYFDQGGRRRQKTFRRKKDALAFAQTAGVEVRAGIHVADSASITVAEAGRNWIATGEAAGLEITTLLQRRQHLDLHIVPFLGATLLSRINVPAVREFEDRLRGAGRSPAMIRKVVSSLGAIFADAQERGQAMRNPVRDMRGGRNGAEGRREKRRKRRLQAGVDIPTPAEVRAIIGAAEGRWRPLLITAVFSGLRASELRGLRWEDVDFDKAEIRVVQRADKYNQIGPPKSQAGKRTIPVPPTVVSILKEWRLACPRRATGERDAAGNPVSVPYLVFPNGVGGVESHTNIVNRGWQPTQVAAGVVAPGSTSGADLKAKYSGLHSIRHFYASWLINRQSDGGLGLQAKAVQSRMGHSTITMTFDTYGHLFPREDDADELARAEAALLGTTAT
jgi:integrase